MNYSRAVTRIDMKNVVCLKDQIQLLTWSHVTLKKQVKSAPWVPIQIISSLTNHIEVVWRLSRSCSWWKWERIFTSTSSDISGSIWILDPWKLAFVAIIIQVISHWSFVTSGVFRAFEGRIYVSDLYRLSSYNHRSPFKGH